MSSWYTVALENLLYRLEDIKWISAKVREMSHIPIRINTNGLSDLMFERDTAPDFQGVVDTHFY